MSGRGLLACLPGEMAHAARKVPYATPATAIAIPGGGFARRDWESSRETGASGMPCPPLHR
jgi:hypothetical protein